MISSPSSIVGDVDATSPKSEASTACGAEAPRHPLVPSNLKVTKKTFTMEEVATHNDRNSCWVVVDGKVYDVTSWLSRHPGGELLITDCGGCDATDPFIVHHSTHVREKVLPRFQIGVVEDCVVPKASEDFRRLAVDLENSEWYDVSVRFYLLLGLWILSLFVGSCLCVFYGTSPWIRAVGGGLLMAFYWQQLAFVGHDVGHLAVTQSLDLDNLLGLIGGNLLTGIGIGWWKATHNVHHVVTNSVQYDPDVQHLPVFAVAESFFKSLHSFYRGSKMEFDHAAQHLVRWQHFLFYPIMAVARVNLYFQSFLLCLNFEEAKRKGVRQPKLEVALLLGFWVWFSALVLQLPTYLEAVTFFCVSHAAAGILHVQICISHFPMETLEGDHKPLSTMDFPTQQLATCLDVDCPKWFDWFHGGLQFQTAHHFFPRAPRHALRELTEVVKDFAERHGQKYSSAGFVDANIMVLKTLRRTAHRVHPWLVDMYNLNG